jgi:hypothetical protein
VIAADEIWWRLMKKGPSKRWWVWAIAWRDAVSYRHLPLRSAQAGRQVLGEYDGVVTCDGYKAYDTPRESPGSEALGRAGSYLKEVTVRAIRSTGSVTLPSDLK